MQTKSQILDFKISDHTQITLEKVIQKNRWGKEEWKLNGYILHD